MRVSSACRWTLAPIPARPSARARSSAESCLIRPYNMATGPPASMPCKWPTWAMYPSTPTTCPSRWTSSSSTTAPHRGQRLPLTLGGDHTIALPILRAMHTHHGPVGPDPCGCACRCQPRHVRRTPGPRHAVSPRGGRRPAANPQGLADWPARQRLLGWRFDWPRQQGFNLVPAHEVWWQSLTPLMAQIRAAIGRTRPPTWI